MELNQADYEERKRRVDAGEGDDDDQRLVKLYEREGYTCRPGGSPSGGSSTSTPSSGDESGKSRRSTARTTEKPSKTSETGDGGVPPTGGAGPSGGS